MGALICANFVAVVLLSWMPKFLYDRFHMGLAMAGLTATVFVQVASMVGAPLGGWLADGWRDKLSAAVIASGAEFVGPLEKPDEPWHYSYRGALETFVGIVAMVGWRRVSASIAWSTPPGGSGL